MDFSLCIISLPLFPPPFYLHQWKYSIFFLPFFTFFLHRSGCSSAYQTTFSLVAISLDQTFYSLLGCPPCSHTETRDRSCPLTTDNNAKISGHFGTSIASGSGLSLFLERTAHAIYLRYYISLKERILNILFPFKGNRGKGILKWVICNEIERFVLDKPNRIELQIIVFLNF